MKLIPLPAAATITGQAEGKLKPYSSPTPSTEAVSSSIKAPAPTIAQQTQVV